MIVKKRFIARDKTNLSVNDVMSHDFFEQKSIFLDVNRLPSL